MEYGRVWVPHVGSNGPASGNQSGAGSPISYGFMQSSGTQQGGSAGNDVIPGVTPSHDRSQEICKYFVNGGCLRGAACPYSHELPDERHLDVNGLGFILNPNVHNAQKTVSVPQPSPGSNITVAGQASPTSTGSPLVAALSQSGGGKQFQIGTGGPAEKGSPMTRYNGASPPPSGGHMTFLRPPARYRPPEPYLEHNLHPVLALPLASSPKEVAQSLVRSLLQN